MSTSKSGGHDEENTGFDFPVSHAQHKPGLDLGGAKHAAGETEGNHRFRRSEEKDIPRERLADRIGKPRKEK